MPSASSQDTSQSLQSRQGTIVKRQIVYTLNHQEFADGFGRNEDIDYYTLKKNHWFATYKAWPWLSLVVSFWNFSAMSTEPLWMTRQRRFSPDGLKCIVSNGEQLSRLVCCLTRISVHRRLCLKKTNENCLAAYVYLHKDQPTTTVHYAFTVLNHKNHRDSMTTGLFWCAFVIFDWRRF